jgi:hypothetical protein
MAFGQRLKQTLFGHPLNPFTPNIMQHGLHLQGKELVILQ